MCVLVGENEREIYSRMIRDMRRAKFTYLGRENNGPVVSFIPMPVELQK